MGIIIFLLFVLLLYITESLVHRRFWNKNLSIKLKFQDNYIFEGEESELDVIIENNKKLPLWWLGIQFEVPDFIAFKDTQLKKQKYYYKDIVSIFSYERITKKYKFTGLKRGVYIINNIELSSSDFFAMNKCIIKKQATALLYVLPKMKFYNTNNKLRTFFGEAASNKKLVEDPFYFRGIRDYYIYDNMKSINWNATAKAGEIKVNEYNSSVQGKLMILINFDSYNEYDKEAVKEEEIRIAAYIACEKLNNGISTGIISNACDILSKKQIIVSALSGRQQKINILKNLSRIDTSNICKDYNEVISEQCKKINDTKYLLLSYYYGEDLRNSVYKARAKGMSIKWILVKSRNDKIINLKREKELYICEVDS